MIDKLLKSHPLVSDQVDHRELRVILRELESVLAKGAGGDIVEFGCYTGTTALFVERLLEARRETRTFHVYDSFAGLPDKTAPDLSPAGEAFRTGELKAAKETLRRHFKQAGLRLPVIHKGWFDRLTPADLPSQIAFAFLDGDYYESIMDSLKLVWPILSAGAVVVVDDYQSEALPGARRAVDTWLRSHRARITVEASLAVVRPVSLKT
jgi:O-methyltransferase